MHSIARIRKLRHVDPVILLATLSLIILGTVMVYSASSLTAADRYGDSAYFLRRHLTWLAIGISVMISVFFFNIRFLKKVALIGILVTGGLLLLGAVTSAGIKANQATRWIDVYGMRFQPSEFVKPAIALYVAAYLSQKGSLIRNFYRGLLPVLLTTGALILMILKQPDFGTAMILGCVVWVMLFVAGARLSHLTSLGLIGVISGYVLIQNAAYRKQRLLAFLNPWEDPKGSGFQILQSFIAFQRGGLQGQGLGDGTQKLHYLPEAHTDFIFSVIAEELGIMGTMAVIILFLCLVIQGFRLALKIKDRFASQLALGITSIIGLQAVLNMAVAMALVPTKGLTLPFVSYGGSSLISTLGAIGILLSLSSTVSLSGKMARRRIR